MTKSTSERTVRDNGLGARRSDNALAHTALVPVIDRNLSAERVGGGIMGVLVVGIDAGCKRVLEPQGAVDSIIGPVDFDQFLTADLVDEPFGPPGQSWNHKRNGNGSSGDRAGRTSRARAGAH